ncbi:hypothetical protein, partial [Hominenteromicrobium sp.]|uniref:hypothetical protein n=1 Tax=Hominenteromicrobium sp. TaxID=3073581 RepID=UPI003A8EB26A
ARLICRRRRSEPASPTGQKAKMYVFSCEILLFRQYRIIEQERFASKFRILIRRGFAAILCVLQKSATTSERKISAKRRSFNYAVLPYILNGWNMKMFPRYSPIIRY